MCSWFEPTGYGPKSQHTEKPHDPLPDKREIDAAIKGLGNSHGSDDVHKPAIASRRDLPPRASEGWIHAQTARSNPVSMADNDAESDRSLAKTGNTATTQATSLQLKPEHRAEIHQSGPAQILSELQVASRAMDFVVSEGTPRLSNPNGFESRPSNQPAPQRTTTQTTVQSDGPSVVDYSRSEINNAAWHHNDMQIRHYANLYIQELTMRTALEAYIARLECEKDDLKAENESCSIQVKSAMESWSTSLENCRASQESGTRLAALLKTCMEHSESVKVENEGLRQACDEWQEACMDLRRENTGLRVAQQLRGHSPDAQRANRERSLQEQGRKRQHEPSPVKTKLDRQAPHARQRVRTHEIPQDKQQEGRENKASFQVDRQEQGGNLSMLAAAAEMIIAAEDSAFCVPE